MANSILQLSTEEQEPDPQIGTSKCRLFIKGYKGKSIAIVHKVCTIIFIIDYSYSSHWLILCVVNHLEHTPLALLRIIGQSDE